MIKSVQIEGFKSFGSPAKSIPLGSLNCLVGANASGKTNFVSALKFLKDALTQNVEFAVGELGGPAEVRNKVQRERKEPKPVSMAVSLSGLEVTVGSPDERVHFENIDYNFQADLRRDDGQPTVISERLCAEVVFSESKRSKYRLERNEKEVSIEDPLAEAHDHPRTLPVPEQEKSRLAAGAGFFSLPAVVFRNYVQGWSFYNIAPEVARLPAKEALDSDLGQSGEHLAAVLHQIEKQNGKGAMETIARGLRSAVPGFETLKTVPLPIDGRWVFQVIERKIKGAISPRSVSDGTIRLLALMVVASWCAERSTLVVIEEPENGLHPHLSRHIVELLRHACARRQFIITTHNPAFLDFLKPEEVILCDKVLGLTQMRHASDVEEIQTFQKRFTLGELWIQGALGGIP